MIGIGTLHLGDVDVILAAIDAGVTLVDTADVYGTEPLVAEARAARPGAPLTVVTKGGLVRAGRAFAPVGLARHLEDAAAASRARLGAPPDVYLLHAVDPRVPLATSVRALIRIRERGDARAIGVGNVNRAQLEEALALTEIAAVEVELSPFDVTAVRGGLVALCAERGIRLLAHRPLGGRERARKLARDVRLAPVAARLGATAAEVALAWLQTLAPVVVPIPGATRVETAASVGRAGRLVLDDDARRALDAAFLGLVAGLGQRAAARTGEVVLLMGMPGAGKSTLAADLAARGYLRLNRDERGGTVDRLARVLDEHLAGDAPHVVLDNTYATRSSRAPVIAAAHRAGVRVRCLWLQTELEDAQVNAVGRMLDRYGRLLEPAELKKLARQDPGVFIPGAQFRWRRELEPPTLDEGFDEVEVRPFTRRAAPGARRALIVELDAADPDTLARWRDAGYLTLATAWLPDAERAADARARAAALGLELAACTHPAGPPICWCRKPLPGLGLALARRHDLDLARSVHVGHGAADRGFASRLGLRYLDAEEWTRVAP